MAYEPTINLYRSWYRFLLQFYSDAYHKRFGEGMEQTFADLLQERAAEDKGLFGYVLWMFVETSLGIIKEQLVDTRMQKNIIRLALGTLAFLIIPLLGNYFVDGWNWSPFDFVFAFGLIFGTGLAYLVLGRRAGSAVYKAAVGMALLAAFLLIWINGAVGIIGNENNPINLLYFGVLAVGFLGALISRLRPQGMAYTLFATAAAQMAVPVIGLVVARPPFTLGVIGVLIINAFFAALFIGSGLLFRQAATANLKALK